MRYRRPRRPRGRGRARLNSPLELIIPAKMTFGGEFYDALRRGEKTLTTRSRLPKGMEEGKLYRVTLDDGFPLLVRPLPKMSFVEAMKRFGGIAEYFKLETVTPVQMPDGEVGVATFDQVRTQVPDFVPPTHLDLDAVALVGVGSKGRKWSLTEWVEGKKTPRLFEVKPAHASEQAQEEARQRSDQAAQALATAQGAAQKTETITPGGGRLLEVPKITAKMVADSPGTLFLFADNFAQEGSPSWRNAPNAVGIPVKLTSGHRPKDFITPKLANFRALKAQIQQAFISLATPLANGQTVVIPKGGLTGGIAQSSPEVSLLVANRLHKLKRDYIAEPSAQKSSKDWRSISSPELPDCSPSTDLYILPITPVMLRRYLNAELLSLAGTPPVEGVLQRASSREQAGEYLSRGHLGIKQGEVALLHQGDQACPRLSFKYGRENGLRDLSLPFLSGDWVDISQMGVESPLRGMPTPSLGIYEKILGRIGSAQAAVSAFGDRGGQGAASLQELDRAFEKSIAARSPDLLPTYYLAPGGYEGKPVALFVVGSIGTLDGMALHVPEPERPLKFDLVAVADAVLTALPSGVAQEACFILPPAVMTGWGPREREVTGRREFQDVLLGQSKTPSPFLHLGHYRRLLVNTYSQNPTGLLRLQDVGDNIIGFGKIYPATDRAGYYGALPYYQDWPGIYATNVLRSLNKGLDRVAIDAAAEAEGWTLPQFLGTKGRKDTLQDHTKAFQDTMRQVRKVQDMDKVIEERLKISDLEYEETVAAVFMENRVPGPHQGEYVPGILYRKTAGGRTVWAPGYNSPLMKSIQQMQADEDLNPKALKTVTLNLVLLNAKNAEAGIRNGPKADRAAEVREVLQKRAIPIDGKDKKEAVWWLAFAPAVIRYVTEEGEERTWARSFPAGASRIIPGAAFSLLRSVMSWNGHIPTLGFVPGRPDAPWAPLRGKYLLDRIEVREVLMLRGEDGKLIHDEKGEAQTVLTAAGKTQYVSRWISAERDPDGYLDAVKRVFKQSDRPDDVIGGELSAASGRAFRGKVAKQGKRTERAKVPIAGQNMPRGFWQWVLQASAYQRREGLGQGKIAEKDQAEAERNYILARNWPALLRQMNAVRRRAKRELLPLNTPPPVDKNNPNPHLEKEALLLLTQMLDEGYEPVLPDLLRPQDNRIAQLSDLYPEEIRESILSIENPRGRRPRRTRRPRGAPPRSNPRSNSRRRSSRKNPLSTEDQEKLKAWAAGPEVAPIVSLPSIKAPETNEEFIEALAALFPSEKVGEMRLRPKEALAALQDHDFFSAFGRAPTKQEEGLFAWVKGGGAQKGKKADEFQKYIGRMAGMSVEEGRDIMEERRQTRRRGRALSPSGALCKLNRNAPRLKKYTPPAAVLTPGTAWIWIGKAPGSNGQIRVMTFRNGLHVDCDQVVKGRHTFGKALAKAIEGMILWLAEKPERRMDMAKGYRVFIGHVGSPKYRVLWKPGDSLNAQLLIRHAFERKLEPPLIFDKKVDQQRYENALPRNETFEFASQEDEDEDEDEKSLYAELPAETKPKTKPKTKPEPRNDLEALLAARREAAAAAKDGEE